MNLSLATKTQLLISQVLQLVPGQTWFFPDGELRLPIGIVAPCPGLAASLIWVQFSLNFLAQYWHFLNFFTIPVKSFLRLFLIKTVDF